MGRLDLITHSGKHAADEALALDASWSAVAPSPAEAA
jgi:hypothetical protein